MADKNEIIDYLRNKQKAAEIEAKVNGINLWVLLGAIAVVSWQLIEYSGSGIWTHYDLALQVLLCTEAIYLLGWLSSPIRSIRDDIRFSSGSLSNIEPSLLFIEGLMYLLPPGLYLIVVGIGASAVLFGLYGLFVLFVSVASFESKFTSEGRGQADRLPKPNFGPTRELTAVVGLLFGGACLFVAVDQLLALKGQANLFSVDLVKSLALLAVLYLLVLIAISRKQRSHGIDWTYELETDLLLESVPPEVALRRIETRALGPRLQDVVNRFFDDLDSGFSELQVSLEKCREQIDVVRGIPIEYPNERSARIEDACAFPKAHISKLRADCRELSKYLGKLGENKNAAMRPGIASLLQSLTARHKLYQNRAIAAEVEFDALEREFSR